MRDTLPKQRIVLLGAGHTNSHVLKMWRMRAITDTELICVSNFRKATYSGMLPAVLAGQYRPEQMTIDLVRLCAAVGAKLIIGNVTGLDSARRELVFADRCNLAFDALSIGIGSRPTFAGVNGDHKAALQIKPMQTFLRRLKTRLEKLNETIGSTERPIRLTVVGGGAGGVEITMCLHAHLKNTMSHRPYEIALVHGGHQLLTGLIDETARRIEQTLDRFGVKRVLGENVVQLNEGSIVLTNGSELPSDVTIWATGATADPLLANLGLPVDDRGFLCTSETLQSTGDPAIFAVGDAGSIAGTPLPKAGVYAVRQGPYLWHNLKRYLKKQPLRRFRPQSTFLKLLNQGDGTAVGDYYGRVFEGKWVWRLKDYIDRKFMSMYQDYEPAMSDNGSPSSKETAQEMRCAGCGGKVGSRILHEALEDLPNHDRAEVMVGLQQPDDAAVLELNSGTRVTITTDFFKAPLQDNFLNGRLSALNALSDVWAMGAEPIAALANVVIPTGHPRAQRRVLREVLEGSVDALRESNTTLAGGHTIEGDALIVGFSIVADQSRVPPSLKSNVQADKILLLSKPLGSGILLAAHMQADCEANWMKPLMRTILLSNQAATIAARDAGATALTDVTGFGLMGHLLEMLEPSNVAAELQLAAVPLLKGAAKALDAGVESTLAPANREAALPSVDVDSRWRESPEFNVLFDPQTNGGILCAMDPANYDTHRDSLDEAGYVQIGHVVEVSEQISSFGRVKILG